jgi:putative tricarboxylic transport membrane protein
MSNRKNVLSSLCLLILGLFLGSQSIRFPIWGTTGPQAGFFPLCVAIVIIGLSLSIAIKSLILIRAGDTGKASGPIERRSSDIYKVTSYVILMIFYGIFMERLGFLITSAFFVILCLRYVERKGWRNTLLIGLGSVGVSYMLFVYLLGVRLPKGIIEWF